MTARKIGIDMQKITGLDSVRGFAAVYVFLSHFVLERIFDKASLFGLPFRFGQEVVILFFLMSGFVIAWSYEQQVDKAFLTFFKKRMLRVYPIYILALILSVTLAGNYSSLLSLDFFFQLFGNLVMLQDFEAGKPGVWFSPLGGDSPLWSLSYEWWFYMLFFPLRGFVNSAGGGNVIACMSFFGFVTYHIFPNQISLIFGYLVIWWAGVEVSVKYRDNSVNWRELRPVICRVAFFALLNFIPCALLMSRGEKLGLGVYPVLCFRHYMACLFFLVVGLLWHQRGWSLFGPLFGVFSRFAPISYALYVLHYPLSVTATYLDPISPRPLMLFCYVMIVFAVSYLAEVKYQRWVTNVFWRVWR
jgi:peptidoglycan/LPS O-acetylase OafA/YrhL